MTDNEMRIAVAEACGWTRVQIREGSGYLIGIPPAGSRYPCVHIGGSNDWAYVPDYPNDLNAMHEAESTLSEEQRDCYVQILCSDTSSEEVCDLSPLEAEWNLLHATARQRCEAFLRTHGKLKD